MYQRMKLSDIFREISNLESDQFKSRSYARGATVVASMSDEEFNERKSFLDISGIGSSLNSKILEYRKTGEVPKLANLRSQQSAYLDPQEYKVRKGFITKRIPLHRINDEIIYDIESTLVTNFRDDLFDAIEYCGSYRRFKLVNLESLIADVDLVVKGRENYTDLVDLLLKSNNYKLIVSGGTKTTFVVNNIEKTTIDVVCTSKESWPFAILHFTGSAKHNIAMRVHAKSLGYKLNEYGIVPIGNQESAEYQELNDSIHFFINRYGSFTTEKDIFNFLNYPYVEPHLR